MTKKVAVIISSTRPTRIGAHIANWVVTKLPQNADVSYEIIDLAEWNLPMFNEPLPPMMGQYQFDETKKWSAKVKEFDGIVVVSPEYNAGYPAALKNAIDYLSVEWKEKPVTIVTYGYTGGASANNQIKEVFVRLNAKVTETLPTLSFTDGIFGDDYQIKDLDSAFGKHATDIEKAGIELIG
jgi:NAD(P)H-dependent FMN reductase